MFELNWVLSSVNGKLLSKSEEVIFSGISTDSRRIMKDELFFALCGDNFDGHNFVQEAFDKGAIGAVVEKPISATANGKVLIHVPSTLRALGDLASAWRKSFKNLKLAAITGSNGKTTTKEMTSSILSLKFNVLKNSGNLNNQIGLPLTLFKLRDSHTAAIVELGMNEFGEIRRLAEIALPDVGAITNVGRAHLEKLGGIEGVAKAKGELVERFTEDNTFVVNIDNPWTRKIAEGVRCQKVRFGISSRCGVEISAKDINPVDFSAVMFKISIRGKEFPVRIRGIGMHNVMNALCASGIALSFGCTEDEIQAGLERFTPAYMRLEVMNTPLGFKVINDAYNANPDSMRKAIEELVRLKRDGRGVAVLGDMLELGSASESEHKSLGEFIRDSGVNLVITYGKYGKNILEGIQGRIDGIFTETHDEIAELLIQIAKPEDLVLVKGSRGMKMENVIQKLFKE
ncbi:MAG TPA: UDP-N-acetylmuramoyl-tripeptide--D-alanyl-D-alanine ligase [Thermodesulfobacteriota bacterium]|nr:UDP-N-acetylmuramoyl-tripeptide--D-alanyl-D-alanine ligase [Thermodesulfobacteriota bacterium]